MITSRRGRWLRRCAKAVLPPALIAAGRRLGLGDQTSAWTYLSSGWPSAAEPGWGDESVLQTQLERWPHQLEAVREPLPLGYSSEAPEPDSLEYGVHNTFMSFAYVLALAAWKKERLSILDWGGGLGQYALLARALHPDLVIDYYCRDLPSLSREGQRLLPTDHFPSTDDEAFARQFDLVMASSSLQYVRDWPGKLAGLAASAAGYLFITRQPFVRSAASFVVKQDATAYGYHTSYPSWVLNRSEFLSAAATCGIKLRREFLILERPTIPRAPEQVEYGGYLFSAPVAPQP